MKYRLCLFLLASLLLSCSTELPKGKTQAESLYKEAVNLREDGRYLLALERLGQIKSQFPYSYYATSAELLQADVYFDQENYVESAAAYTLFRDFHPKFKLISYVVFKIAESYYYQLPSTFDRDLSPAYEAIKYYDEVIQRYPNSEYVEQSRKKKDLAQEMLRKKDRYVADFYYKTGVFDSARFRYLDILEKYKDAELVEHSIYRVVKSSQKLESYSDCVRYSEKYLPHVSPKLREQLEDMQKDCQEDFDEVVKSQQS